MRYLEDWLRAVQRYSMPFLDSSQVVARLDQAQRDGHLMPPSGDQYDDCIHRLWSTCPEFFEAREQRSLDSEAALLRASGRNESGAPGATHYQLRQSLEFRLDRFPGTGVLVLWIPVPRSIPGVQEVRLTSALPEALREHYLPEAGLIQAAPVLLDPHDESTPRLELCFDVKQFTSTLSQLRETNLVPIDLPIDQAVKNWLRQNAIHDGIEPAARVDAVVDAMEASFRGTIHGPAQPKELVQCGRGNLETLSVFAVNALQQLGLGARLAAGQALMMPGNESTLRWPDGFGYEHRFVHWADLPSGAAGTVDLTYFMRWGFASTPTNTREERTQQSLGEIGRAYRAMLRRQVYSVDLVLAGVARKSFFMNLRSPRERFWLKGGIDTEIRAIRLESRS